MKVATKVIVPASSLAKPPDTVTYPDAHIDAPPDALPLQEPVAVLVVVPDPLDASDAEPVSVVAPDPLEEAEPLADAPPFSSPSPIIQAGIDGADATELPTFDCGSSAPVTL